MVATAAAIDDRPSAFRFPRGEGVGVDMPERGAPLEIGKGRVVKEGTKIALLSFGARLQECLKAAEELDAMGLSATVADARFAKPLDHDLIRDLAGEKAEAPDQVRGCVSPFGKVLLQSDSSNPSPAETSHSPGEPSSFSTFTTPSSTSIA